jgi:hypothetical protein
MSRILFIMLLVLAAVQGEAAITGQCSDCHTMHNSQNGAVVVSFIYGTETTDAKEYLLIGSCMGCHAQGGSSMIATINGNDVPQVYHTDSTGDLAGGNFAYIIGTKGSGASDNKGHNVMDFGNSYLESTHSIPPGYHAPTGGTFPMSSFTCAGFKGCHGERNSTGIRGAHHGNVDGQLNTADESYNSYRFLFSVKGLENTGSFKWQNKDASNHNEYFGATTPVTYLSNCTDLCHLPPIPTGGIMTKDNTMSGFCGTCHRGFHVIDQQTTTQGIGNDTVSPFQRHPTDVILPNSGEYQGYTSYSITAPVARTSVPGAMSSTVTPGTDVVMCLSCHTAHASDYDDMMRWDYRSATLATAISGCSTCHTDKD